MENNRRKVFQNENTVLFSEVKGVFPLCAKILMYTKSGRKEWVFEAAAYIYHLNPTAAEEIGLLKDEQRLQWRYKFNS